MFLWRIFATHSLIIFIFLLVAPSPSGALPVNPFLLNDPSKASVCGDGRTGPCICGNKRTIRDPRARYQCGDTSTQYYFGTTNSDPSLFPFPTTEGQDLYCMFIVDLAWLASQVNGAHPALCDALLKEEQKYLDLYNYINHPPNVHLLEATVVRAINNFLNGKTPVVTLSDVKPLRTAVEYLKFMLSEPKYPGITTAAEGLGNLIENLVPGKNPLSGGTDGFVNQYKAKVAQAIESAEAQIKHYPVLIKS